MSVIPESPPPAASAIPEGWDERGLLRVASIVNGQVNPEVEPYRSMILLAPDHVSSGTGRVLEYRTAAQQRAISGKYRVSPGDVVYSKIRPHLRKAALATFDGLCSADMYPLKPAEDVDGRFLLATLLSERFSEYAESVSVRSGMPKINRRELADFSVLLPPKEEQAEIGRALAAADGLLGSLDELLRKKRDIARGAQQALLSGRVRLRGFQDRWSSRRIDQLAEIVSGGTPRTSRTEYWSGSIPWCTPTDVTGFAGKYLHDTARTISEAGLANSGAEQLPAGALLLCTRATVGDVRIAGRPMCTNQGFKSLICHPGVNNEFVYYALPTLKSKMLASAFGSTFLELSKRNLGAIELHLPDDEAEQSAIATVLSDLDAELEALEARRAKTLAIKQGMMQALLTGRIRLT